MEPSIFTPKISTCGNYLPFYGYTSVSFVKFNEEWAEKWAQIEAFLHGSTLHKWFSPLPYKSYHMTLFNITSVNSPIPILQKWMDKNNTKPPKNNWFPPDALTDKMLKAREAAKHIKKFKVKLNGLISHHDQKHGTQNLAISVKPEADILPPINQYRKSCAQLFDHADEVIEVKFGFHITLGYKFKETSTEEEAEIAVEEGRLYEYINKIVGETIPLEPADVHWYDSMKNFMTYEEMEIFNKSYIC